MTTLAAAAAPGPDLRADIDTSLDEEQRSATPNEDEGKRATPPPWVDKAFIADTLKASDAAVDERSVEIVRVEEVCGGYLSQTFRFVARYRAGGATPRETSVIVKIAPHSEGILKDVIESGVFTKEQFAYGTFLPAVEAALRAVDLGDWRPMWPRFYRQGSRPSDFLVIEDLDASGFRKVSEGGALGVEQCAAALRGLARLHAASATLVDGDQYRARLFHESLLFKEKSTAAYEAQIVEGFGHMVDIFDEYPWFRKYKSKLAGLGLSIVTRTLDVVNKSKVDFKVMLHGDFHKNNMMFRRDGKSLQVRVYDFQGVHVGSPAEDLQYFLHTSASLEVLRDHVDELLAEYHGALQQTLRALGLQQQADDYPLEALQADMDRFGMVAVYITFNILPLILDTTMAEQLVDLTMEDYEQKADAFRQRYYRNERFLSYVEYLIPLFDSKGYFESE